MPSAFRSNYSKSDYLTTKVDWLEVTVKNRSPGMVIDQLLAIRDTKEFKPLPKGRSGYDTQLKWESGNVFVLYNTNDKGEPIPNDQMGVHVIMTGTGCRAFEARHPLRDIILLFIFAGHYNFTRIDIAIDDTKEKLLKGSKIQRYVKKGLCTSRWTTASTIHSYTVHGYKSLGSTTYLGSRTSKIYCRIYDKAVEQRLKCKNNPQRLKRLPKHWTRMELIFKKERANQFAKQFLLDLQGRAGEAVRSALNTYIRFLTPRADQSKERWKSARWWDKFLGEVGKLKLTQDKTPQSIERMESWVKSQVGPTLSAILLAHEGDLGWITHTITKCRKRMKNKHYTAVNQYQSQKARKE